MDQSVLAASLSAHIGDAPAGAASLTRSASLASSSGNPKPKQRRNKPTLSCQECVEHKTKCDRARPQCLACRKRSSRCTYSQIANILAVSDGKRGKHRKSSKAQDDIASAEKCSIANITHPTPQDTASSHDSPSHLRSSSQSATALSGHRSSFSSFDPAANIDFGVGKEHPFANYWTCNGGLAEIIRVLPTKDQADILLQKYFDIVDPINPILGERSLWLSAYEQFWALSQQEKCNCDAAMVGLHFVIYAIATQYIELPSSPSRTKTAEFYIFVTLKHLAIFPNSKKTEHFLWLYIDVGNIVSAAHQALKISSYLYKVTITTVQAMALIFYFLVNDNQISEAWTFGGITQRQAYVLQLHRAPDIVVPHIPTAEKNMRCMLWSALMYQETGISIQLKFPSTSTQSDVVPHSFRYHETVQDSPLDHNPHGNVSIAGDTSAFEMSAGIKSDISYCRSLLAYSRFCQDHVCRARALDLPICKSNEHRSELLLAARSVYRSLPHPFGSYDPNRFFDCSRRLARQQITLTQSFFHTLMWICADENQQSDVIPDFYGILDHAHEALQAFFAIDSLFADEPTSWWTYLIRAFEEVVSMLRDREVKNEVDAALLQILIANVLAAEEKPMFPPAQGSGARQEYQMIINAKEDVRRVLEILWQRQPLLQFKEAQEARYRTLKAVYDRITIV